MRHRVASQGVEATTSSAGVGRGQERGHRVERAWGRPGSAPLPRREIPEDERPDVGAERREPQVVADGALFHREVADEDLRPPSVREPEDRRDSEDAEERAQHERVTRKRAEGRPVAGGRRRTGGPRIERGADVGAAREDDPDGHPEQTEGRRSEEGDAPAPLPVERGREGRREHAAEMRGAG